MGARTRGIANQILSGGLDATDGLSGVVPSSNITNASVTSVSSTPSIGGGFDKVASDPPSPVEGDIWFNTTSNTVKGYVFAPAAWSTGGNLPRIRFDNMGAKLQTQTAALSVGGYSPITPGVGAPNTDEYDGSSWTTGGNLNTARVQSATGGTQTSAISAGGDDYSPNQQSAAEEYNGSSWTSVTSMPFSANRRAAAGSQTAAIYVGGFTAGPTGNTTTQADEYNGTSWTTVTAHPYSAQQIAATGTQTAGLFTTGATKPTPASSTVYTDATTEYDGSAWTSGGTYPLKMNQMGSGGTQTAALFMGGVGSPTGSPPITWVGTANTYDGTSYSATATMSVKYGQSQGSGSATQGDGIVYGGYDGAETVATTEEYNVAAIATKTLTSS